MPILMPESLECALALPEELVKTSRNQSIQQDDEVQPAPRRTRCNPSNDKRWAIILAGGDGIRLRNLTQLISGDERPKQFCNLLGPQTLLERTRERVEKSIRGDQMIIALTRSNEVFYQDHIGDRSRWLVQPCDRGTAPAIILSLLHVATQTPDAVVAIFPSDHYYSNEAAFNAALESAFQIATDDRDALVLLGAQPQRPAVEFAWIDIGPRVNDNVFRVRAFEQKPNPAIAEDLFRSGALWNTSVIVGNVLAFLWMSFVTLPELVSQLEASGLESDENGVLRVPLSAYDAVPKVDFSKELLAPNAHRVLALRLQEPQWQALSRPERGISIVRSRSTNPRGSLLTWDSSRRRRGWRT